MRKKLYLLLTTVVMLLGLMTVTAAAESYYWPVPDNTKVTQKWGGDHYGIDIGWNLAVQPVAATKSGTVVKCYYVTGTNYGYGNGMVIRHTDGSGYSMYAHLESMTVKQGDPVTRGQLIGYMGNTGNSKGKHLHFELCSNVDIRGSYYDGHPESSPKYQHLGTYSINSNPGAIQYSYTLCEHDPVFKSDYKVVCSACNETLSLPALTSAPGYLQIVLPKGKSDAPSHVTPYGDATVKTRYEKGETVFVRGYLENAFGNKWYQLSTGEWLVEGYLDTHYHCYNSKGICDLCTDRLSVVSMNNTTLALANGKTSAPVHFAPYGASMKWTYQGSTVTVNGKVVNGSNNVWYRTTDGAWIYSKYVNSPVSGGIIKSSSGSLALNNAPAASPKSSKMLAEMPTGSAVSVYTSETTGNWLSVYYNGQVGYAYKSYITVMDGYKGVEPPQYEEEGLEVAPVTPAPDPAPAPAPAPAPSTVTVSLTPPTDPAYTKKISVSDHNAVVVTNIRKSAGSQITASGMWLYDANGNLIKEHRHSVTNVGNSNTNFHSWYDINAEVGVTLESGTTYKYRFFVVVNGSTYQSDLYSFTTTGQAPAPAPAPAPVPAVYRLTLDPNGGTATMSYKDITYNTVIGTLPVPTRDGYTFDGWYSAAEGGNPVRETMTYNADFNITVYAHWKPNTYRLTLNPNGGTTKAPYKDIVFDTTIGTLTVPTRAGYTFAGWYSAAEGGNPIYETMRYNAPFDVTIYAHWTAAAVVNPFIDVAKGSYYHDAVLWAKQNNVTGGTSANTFSPNLICTRSQVVTFLWSAQGKPEPKTKVNPFTDVKESDWFYKPVLWAVEQGITSGTSATTFSPNTDCTSAQVLTFLWAANGRPAAATTDTAWYGKAVTWANNSGLTGNMGTAFSPANPSPRSEIVTYLYRNAGSPGIAPGK